MKTRLLLIVVLLFLLPFHLFPQEQKVNPDKTTLQPQQAPQEQQGLKRVYEFGLKFINLNNFGIGFKIGNQKTLYRLSILALNFNTGKGSGSILDTASSPKTQNYGAGLRLGLEKRIVLAKNFYLLLGSDIGIAYNHNKMDWNVTKYPDSKLVSWELAPAIYIVTGLSYQVGEHFIITAEFSPSFEYDFGRTKATQSAPNYDITFHHFNFELSTRSVSLTIAYRILKTVLFKW